MITKMRLSYALGLTMTLLALTGVAACASATSAYYKGCPDLKYDATTRSSKYDADQSVALMQAVYREDEVAAAAAIKKGADVNKPHDRRDFECRIGGTSVSAYRTPQWTYPLYEAAHQLFNASMTGLLLRAGARMDAHPFDLMPEHADSRQLVVRMPWSFYGRSRGERHWEPVMAAFVANGFVMSGEYLAGKVDIPARAVAYQMLTPSERARFDSTIAKHEQNQRAADLAAEQARQEANARYAENAAAARRVAAATAAADNESLSEAIGATICKQGVLRANICLPGTPLCEKWSSDGYLYGYVEGASPDRRRLQIRLGGALLPPGVPSAAPNYRGTTFDGLEYRHGQIIWAAKREWNRCEPTTSQFLSP